MLASGRPHKGPHGSAGERALLEAPRCQPPAILGHSWGRFWGVTASPEAAPRYAKDLIMDVQVGGTVSARGV